MELISSNINTDALNAAVKTKSDEEENVESKKIKLDEPELKIETKSENAENGNEEKSCRKKKVALLLGYSGEGYYGLQRYSIFSIFESI
jgi:hypothetical protein